MEDNDFNTLRRAVESAILEYAEQWAESGTIPYGEVADLTDDVMEEISEWEKEHDLESNLAEFA